MLKKFVSILALAGLASGPAFAATNLGFDLGMPGWSATNGDLTPVNSLSTQITVFNDYDFNSNGVSDDNLLTPGYIESMSGARFGLLNNNNAGPVTFAFNTGGSATVANDMLWLRLFSAEYDFQGMTGGVNDDFVRLTSSGTDSNGSFSDTDVFYASQGAYVDSGWKGFTLREGTTSLQIALVDVNGFNAPQVGIDFTAAPVPEPEVNLMMLAGLGVLGVMSRRRAKRAA